MSESCTQKVYAYWRECDHLTLDLGGSCPVCAKIEKRVKAARVEGRRSAFQDVAKGIKGVRDIIDKLIETEG